MINVQHRNYPNSYYDLKHKNNYDNELIKDYNYIHNRNYCLKSKVLIDDYIKTFNVNFTIETHKDNYNNLYHLSFYKKGLVFGIAVRITLEREKNLLSAFKNSDDFFNFLKNNK